MKVASALPNRTGSARAMRTVLSATCTSRFCECAEASRSASASVVSRAVAEIGRMIPDAESIFETEILSASRSETILSEAREALMLRNLQALRAVDQLKTSAESLEERTRRLEESNKRDPLTNLFNRSYLDHYLRDAFALSIKNDTPLNGTRLRFAINNLFDTDPPLADETYGYYSDLHSPRGRQFAIELRKTF